ncbi:MAG: SPOR domain-containing protein [Holosporales bacterium]|jgi:cell division protein FtsN|nr:SPOR domain-containing protein [Holosporales bacterium]
MTMLPDGEYKRSNKKNKQPQRKNSFLLLGIAGAGVLVLCALGMCLFKSSTPSSKTPLIKAPETPAKIYPQESGQQDPLQETSVYNRIASAPQQTPFRSEEVKPLPAPEEPVPPLQEEERMELTPEERTQLEGIVDTNNAEEEEVLAENLLPQSSTATSEKPTPLEELETVIPSSGPSDKAQRQESVQTDTPSESKQGGVSRAVPPMIKKSPLQKVTLSHPLKGFKVQIASLETREHAVQEWNRLKHRPIFKSLSVEIARVDLGRTRGIRHRVYVGPFSSKQAAVRFVSKLKDHHIDALVVTP